MNQLPQKNACVKKESDDESMGSIEVVFEQ